MKWEEKTLDMLGEISRGKSKHRPRNDSILFGGPYPFIQTADVKKANLYITEYDQTYSEIGLAQSKLWNEGTLCITIAANIADTAILGMKACFPDSIMGFVPYEGVSDAKFVKYMFDILQKECKNISQGTAQDNLSWEKLSTIKFRVPDYDTQIRIVKFLATYDDLIENNQKQIKLLEEAAQRLYKEWFVDLRFPGHENVKIADGIPEGWENTNLGSIDCCMESGSRPKGGINKNCDSNSIPSIGAENVIGLGKYNFSSDKYITKEFFAKMRRGILKNKDILIYKDGAYIGRTTLFQDDFPHKQAAVNEHVFLLHATDESLQYYLFFTLYQQEYFQKMQSLNKNAAQPGLNQNAVFSLDFVLPNKVVINQFNSVIEPIMSKLFIKAKQIKLVQEARDRLLNKLMSGELEVE